MPALPFVVELARDLIRLDTTNPPGEEHIAVELIEPATDRPPLGVGEASGGPTVAAIGNAVAHALGARIRDLPLTRERVMAALLRT